MRLKFQERVEGRGAEHVHLVDDINLVFAQLRREAHLVNQIADIVNRIVRGRIELVYIERLAGVERVAALAPVTGFSFRGHRAAIDGFGKDARAGGFSYAARTAEQVCLGKLAAGNGILERGGDVALTHHRVEVLRPVLAG
jgi:hypothetical protein